MPVQPRPYALASEVRPGHKLVSDGLWAGMPTGIPLEVKLHDGALCVPCSYGLFELVFDEGRVRGFHRAPRGFAAMDPTRQQALARKGGASVPAHKRSFATDRNLAAVAGCLGGLASHGGGRPKSLEQDQ